MTWILHHWVSFQMQWPDEQWLDIFTRVISFKNKRTGPLTYFYYILRDFFPQNNKSRKMCSGTTVSFSSRSEFRTSVDRDPFSRSLVSGLALLGCFEPLLSIVSGCFGTSVGGTDRPVGHSRLTARVTSPAGICSSVLPRPWGAQRDSLLGTGRLNTISTAVGIKKKKKTKHNATATVSSRCRCTCHTANWYSMKLHGVRVTHARLQNDPVGRDETLKFIRNHHGYLLFDSLCHVIMACIIKSWLYNLIQFKIYII